MKKLLTDKAKKSLYPIMLALTLGLAVVALPPLNVAEAVPSTKVNLSADPAPIMVAKSPLSASVNRGDLSHEMKLFYKHLQQARKSTKPLGKIINQSQTQSPSIAEAPMPYSPEQQAINAQMNQEVTDLDIRGSDDLQSGNLADAAKSFEQALSVESEDSNALIGLADTCQQNGDFDTAIQYYRAAIYTSNPNIGGLVPGDGYQDNNIIHLMHFALALNSIGNAVEAVKVYNRAAWLTNFDAYGGTRKHEIPLPEFGENTGQIAYDAQKLAAMAYIAIGLDKVGQVGPDDPEPLHNFQQALTYAPSSAVAHFYLGKYLFRINNPGAKAELQKAADLGDDETASAAKDMLKVVR